MMLRHSAQSFFFFLFTLLCLFLVTPPNVNFSHEFCYQKKAAHSFLHSLSFFFFCRNFQYPFIKTLLNLYNPESGLF